jgi:predicted Zn-ribbon and HTH transcriptional regulator
MILNPMKFNTFSNIHVFGKGTEHITFLTPDMILKKKLEKEVHRKDGTLDKAYSFDVNIDFWKEQPKPLSIVLDEAHILLNSRESFSRKNRKITEWIALIRRVLGSNEGAMGELVLITQLSRRLDVIAREQAHQIRYHICHYTKKCPECSLTWHETSETPEKSYYCPRCKNRNLQKSKFIIQIWCFSNIIDFESWRDFGAKTFYKEYFVNDIEDTSFPYYDSYQWDSLFSEY